MRLVDVDTLDVLTIIGGRMDGKVEFAKAINEMIQNAPIVDAVPVRHGKWIDEGQYADYHPHHAWRCSECGEHVIEIDPPWYKYCPNCGAKMDK